MTKLKEKEITAADIREYLNNYSDFSFEVKTQKQLVTLGFSCQHGGTYEDPISGKHREFDIRATKSFQHRETFIYRLCLSVECKNLRPNFPLVIHCSPRTEKENYQDLIWSSVSNDTLTAGLSENGVALTLKSDKSIYRALDPVGKSSDQVGRRAGNDNEIVSNDGDVFDKISQAINSSFTLIRNSHYAGDRDTTIVSNVVPVLVIPKNRLWTVWYDNSGEIVEGPTCVPSVSYYVGKTWTIKGRMDRNYRISHLEIVELESLPELIKKHTDPELFSAKALFETLMSR